MIGMTTLPISRSRPFFDDFSLELKKPSDIKNARALLVLGDSVTTDHISPAGAIPEEYPAGQYLKKESGNAGGVQLLWFQKRKP